MADIPDAGGGPTSRRDFIRASSILMAGGAVSDGLGLARSVHAQGTDVIRIGLVGCGSRGSAAASQALNTAEGRVELVALADVFPDRLQQAYRRIKGEHPDKTRVDPERRFVGLHAYRDLLAADVDLVILATPPGFRPLHFAAAVEAGKHVFLETPVAVDVPGVRRVLSASAAAREKRLAVAVGLQRRHDAAYQETIQQLRNGIIGDLVTLRVYWNGAGVRPRAGAGRPNWNTSSATGTSSPGLAGTLSSNSTSTTWTSATGWSKTTPGRPMPRVVARSAGDVESKGWISARSTTIFSVSIAMAAARGCSASAATCPIAGTTSPNMWMRRPGMPTSAGERSTTERGRSSGRPAAAAGHQQEFDDLLAALRAGRIPQEAEYGAASTMTAILGRIAAYRGRPVAWDEAMASELELADTDALTSLEQPAPVEPDDEGNYPVAAPGATRAV